MSSIRRIGIVVAFAAVTIGAGATGASATQGPEPDRYSDRRTHAGPDGARSEQRISCVGTDGEVYHERTTKRATPKGEGGQTVRRGDPAACADDRDTFTAPGFLGSGGPINVETGDVRVLSPGDN